MLGDTQNMKPTQRAYLELHLAVFLFGFTAILGKLITLSALVMVWWRVLITCISLFFLIQFGKKLKEIPRKLILKYMGIGIIVAVHWICFFGSAKMANASVALVCMATASFFTAFLEPLFFKTKIQFYEILLAVMVIPGMVLIVNNLDADMNLGIIVGLISAFLASLFGVLNKKYVNDADSKTITFLELGSGWLFISLVLPFFFANNTDAAFMPVKMDWAYLLFLALACTTLAYVISLRALKHISAFNSMLTYNLEPVYGIFMAYFLLGEKLSNGFYWGVLIILGAVFLYPFLKKKT